MKENKKSDEPVIRRALEAADPILSLSLTVLLPTHHHLPHRRLQTKSKIVDPPQPTTMATATTAATTSSPPPSTELKTYWCHECDMSVSLTPSPSPSPSPLLCPHCNTHFLELMDSPLTQNDTVEPPLPSALFDVVFQDALALLSPPPPPKPRAIIIPVISVTASLLSSLDPNGVVLCAVCKDLISVDSEAKQLPCEHLYHSNCITPWLDIRASCPLCRFNLVEEEEDEGGENGEDDDEVNASAMRRQLVMRLSALSEDDFYGLRITLNHIASRHALLHSSSSSADSQNPSPSGGDGDGDGESES